MNEPYETHNYRNIEIEIYNNVDVESPDTWGNEERFIVYDHRDFTVTREGFVARDIFNHCVMGKTTMYKGYYAFVLFAYIHGGVSLSISNASYPFNDRFDVSTTGFVLIKRQKGTWTLKQALQRAKDLIVVWNEWLSGDVWGYNSEAGSCYGYFGEIGKRQMLKEAYGEIDCYLADKQRKHFEYLKTMITNKVPLMKRKAMAI